MDFTLCTHITARNTALQYSDVMKTFHGNLYDVKYVIILGDTITTAVNPDLQYSEVARVLGLFSI
jgi:hypothetical protein